MSYKLILKALIVFIVFSVVGCASGPTLYTSAQNTPFAHPENKVLFVNLLDENGTPKKDKKAKLSYGYALDYAEISVENVDQENQNCIYNLRFYDDEKVKQQRSKECEEEHEKNKKKAKGIPQKDIIQKGDEFSIILNAVWIPEMKDSIFDQSLNFAGIRDRGRDIAVVLDIIAEDGEAQPLVVAYQRGVQGKHLLNFKNIVVYNNSNWDGIHQPYFHLRIVDVTAERNKNTQEMLDAAASSVNSLAGIVPSSYFPHISQAIKTSKYILGEESNRILLDYKIQFFNLSISDNEENVYSNYGFERDSETASVSRILDRFAQGNWMAIGRPYNHDPKFWDADFYQDRKTGEIIRNGGENQNKVVNVPYVSMIVVKKDFGISKDVLKSFNEFSEIILNGESRTSGASLKEIAKSITKISDDLINDEELVNSLVFLINRISASENYEEKIHLMEEVVSQYVKSENNRVRTVIEREMLVNSEVGIHYFLKINEDNALTVDNRVNYVPDLEKLNQYYKNQAEKKENKKEELQKITESIDGLLVFEKSGAKDIKILKEGYERILNYLTSVKGNISKIENLNQNSDTLENLILKFAQLEQDMEEVISTNNTRESNYEELRDALKELNQRIAGVADKAKKDLLDEN